MTIDESYARSLVERLYENRRMRTQAETDRFIAAMQLLKGHPRNHPIPGLLPSLLRVFDDQCEMHEVMWGVIHYIELYDMDEYLAALTHATPELVPSAVGWLAEIYLRILLHDQLRNTLIVLLASLPVEILQAIYHVMEQIEEDYDERTDVSDMKAQITTLLTGPSHN
jgi:hypothetical protein